MIKQDKTQEYKLIAFDMDGTLLSSDKTILKSSKQAIQKAADAGKIVVLSTGRGPAELADYIPDVPSLRYMICVSGALIYDLQKQCAVYRTAIAPDVVKQLIDFAELETARAQLLTDRSIVQRDFFEHMDKYHMSAYVPLYDRCADKWENMPEQFAQDPFPVEKVNLYHLDTDSRMRTKQRIEAADLPVELAFSEYSSLECSAFGIDKGTGLKRLCEALHIPLQQTIAVGDAENDLGILRTAGLAVAMGNAAQSVQDIADVTVADCDHDGCAQAIERYLLGSCE